MGNYILLSMLASLEGEEQQGISKEMPGTNTGSGTCSEGGTAVAAILLNKGVLL